MFVKSLVLSLSLLANVLFAHESLVSFQPETCTLLGESDATCIADRQSLKAIHFVIRQFDILGIRIHVKPSEYREFLVGIRTVRSSTEPPLKNFRSENEKCMEAYFPLFLKIQTKLKDDGELGEEILKTLCAKLSQTFENSESSSWLSLSPWFGGGILVGSSIWFIRKRHLGPALLAAFGLIVMTAPPVCCCGGSPVLKPCPRNRLIAMGVAGGFLLWLFGVPVDISVPAGT